MNRLYIKTIAFAAVSAMLLGSCSQEQSAPAGSGIKTAHFGDQTRVEFNEITGKFAWSDPDEIALHLSSGAYTNVTVKASGVFNLTMDAGVTQDAYAVYPSNVVDPANYGNPDLKIELPAAYTVEGATGMEDWYPTPMVAVNNPRSDDLWFYHTGGAARLIMNDVPAGTASIEVNFGKRVTGSFAVNNPSTATPTIETEDSADNTTVTFNLATALAAETDDYILNVPVPTGKYTSLEVVMKDAGGNALAMHNSTRTRSFYRARGRKIHIPFVETEEEYILELTPPVFGQYGGPGVFSIRSYKSDDSGESWVDFAKVEFSEDGGTTWSEDLPAWLRLEDADFSADGLSIDCNLDAAINRGVSNKVWAGPTTFDPNVVTDLSKQDIYGNPIAQSTANCYVVSAPGWYKFPAVYGNALKGGLTNETAYHSLNTEPDALVNFVRHDGNAITAPWIRDNGILLSDACLVWQDEPGLVSQISFADDYVTFFVDPETVKQGNAVIAIRDAEQKIAWSWHIWVMDSPALKLGTKKVYSSIEYLQSSSSPTAILSTAVTPIEMMSTTLGWSEPEEIQSLGRSVIVRVTQEESDLVKQCEIAQEPNDAFSSHGNNPYYQWGRKDPMLPARGDGLMGSENVEYNDHVFPFDVNASKSQYYEQDEFMWKAADSKVGATLAQSIQHPNVFYRRDGSVKRDIWLLPEADGLIHALDLWNASEGYLGSKPFDKGEFGTDIIEDKIDIPIIKTVYDPCPVGFTVPSLYAFNGFAEQDLSIENSNTFNPLASNSASVVEDYGFYLYCDYWGASDSPRSETIFLPFSGMRAEGYCIPQTFYHVGSPDYSGSNTADIDWADNALGFMLMGAHTVYLPIHWAYDAAIATPICPIREVEANPGMIFTGNAGSYGHDDWN